MHERRQLVYHKVRITRMISCDQFWPPELRRVLTIKLGIVSPAPSSLISVRITFNKDVRADLILLGSSFTISLLSIKRVACHPASSSSAISEILVMSYGIAISSQPMRAKMLRYRAVAISGHEKRKRPTFISIPSIVCCINGEFSLSGISILYDRDRPLRTLSA